MPENGAKTVEFCLNWKPAHGCQISWVSEHVRFDSDEIRIGLSWTKPRVKSLRRIEFFEIKARYNHTAEVFYADLDRQVERHIDRIVHADSVRLLAQGNRSQRADTDRFEAEQILKGELCPV